MDEQSTYWTGLIAAAESGGARSGRPLGGPLPDLPDTPEGRLAVRLRRSRVERGMSQADLAGEMTRLGHPWHQTTVAKTERGEREPRYTELLALTQVLGLDRQHWLVLEPGPSQSHAPEPQVYRLEQEQQLVRLRVDYLDRDIAQLQSERKAMQERLKKLERELRLARESRQQADQP